MASDESLMSRRVVRRVYPLRLAGVVVLYGVCIVCPVASFSPHCCPTLAHPFVLCAESPIASWVFCFLLLGGMCYR